MHLLLKAPDHTALHGLLSPLIAKIKTPENVQWMVDVDPSDMM